MLKKLTAALLVSGLALVAAPAAGAAVAASEPTVVQTKKSDYKKKDRNKFWRAVKREDRDFRIIGKKDSIEMGTLTCDLLRAGGDLFDLSMLVYEADPLIEDMLIISFAYAPVYLCPEQLYKFD